MLVRRARNMKSGEWHSRAKGAHWRRWLMGRRLRPGAVELSLEVARYLLIANGATLIASIGGIGEAWHAPELRPVFAILVSQFIWGFSASMCAWVFFSGAALRATQARAESDPYRSRRLAVRIGLWMVLGFLAAATDLIIIAFAGIAILAHLATSPAALQIEDIGPTLVRISAFNPVR
jgi:hypothetical protein